MIGLYFGFDSNFDEDFDKDLIPLEGFIF